MDGQGRPSTATSEGVIGADGVDLPDGLGELTRDHDRLRRLVVVTAPDLDLPAGRPDPGLLAQLAAARASLATLEEREQPAPVEPAVAAELAQLDDRLRDAADAEDRARHHRAAVRLSELTREPEVIADLDATAEDESGLLPSSAERTEMAPRRAAATTVASGKAFLITRAWSPEAAPTSSSVNR